MYIYFAKNQYSLNLTDNFTFAYYVIDVLKYLSVPAAIFEFLSKEKQQRIEQWIVKRLPQILKTFAITFLSTFLLVLILTYGGYWIVVSYFVISKIITSFSNDYDNDYSSFFFMSLIVALVFAAVQHWVLPDSWTYALAYPFEYVSEWLNSYSFLDPIIPDFKAQEFITDYEAFFKSVYQFDSAWWSYFLKVYLFSTKGFMLIILIVINMALLVSFFTLASVVLLFPFNLFIKFSNYLKVRFSLNKGNIPIGAFLIWCIAETVFIILRSINMFGS